MLSFSAVTALALEVVEDDFADAHALWSHLYVFVGLDVLECLFEGKLYRRNDARFVVCSGCTSIGELLCLSHIDDKVDFVNVLAYDLTGIDLVLREDEELSTVLKVVNGIGYCCT